MKRSTRSSATGAEEASAFTLRVNRLIQRTLVPRFEFDASQVRCQDNWRSSLCQLSYIFDLVEVDASEQAGQARDSPGFRREREAIKRTAIPVRIEVIQYFEAQDLVKIAVDGADGHRAIVHSLQTGARRPLGAVDRSVSNERLARPVLLSAQRKAITFSTEAKRGRQNGRGPGGRDATLATVKSTVELLHAVLQKLYIVSRKSSSQDLRHAVVFLLPLFRVKVRVVLVLVLVFSLVPIRILVLIPIIFRARVLDRKSVV